MNTSDLGRRIQASIMQGMYVSEKVAAFREKALKMKQEKQRKALEESIQQMQESSRYIKAPSKSGKPMMAKDLGYQTSQALQRGPPGL